MGSSTVFSFSGRDVDNGEVVNDDGDNFVDRLPGLVGDVDIGCREESSGT